MDPQAQPRSEVPQQEPQQQEPRQSDPGLATNPNGEDSKPSGHEKDADTDTAADWATLLEAASEHDDRLLQDWKDDLGNLLIFAGLFSSVVTGFAAESYTSLQTDNSDISVQLLAQISAQLAAFSVSQGFVNSTVVPIPLSTLTAPSRPSELNVRINILWFLSLAMSLTASLLAIIVQQWLRAYRLPGHVSGRQRIRLRQYRHKAMHDWGVPGIIGALPFLLQIALVLFLTGLCYLLASLDDTVAKAFIAFVGVALSFYFAAMVLPIARRRCPYRSPLAMGIIATMRILRYATAIVFFLSYFVLSFLVLLPAVLIAVAATPIIWVAAVFRPSNQQWLADLMLKRHGRLWDSWGLSVDWVSRRVMSLGRPKWRERDEWAGRDLDALSTDLYLDMKALVWAPSTVSLGDRTVIQRCLEDLSSEEQVVCVCAWASQMLNISAYSFRRLDNVKKPLNPVTLSVLAKVDTTFSDGLRHVLLKVIPDDLTFGRSGRPVCYESALLLTRHVARLRPADSEWTMGYATTILKIRSQQDFTTDCAPIADRVRLPTACLFELSTIVQYSFSAQELGTLFGFAIETHIKWIDTRPESDTAFFGSCLDIMLASCATATHALSRQPDPAKLLQDNSSLRADCERLLSLIDQMVTKFALEIQRQGTYLPDHFHDGVLLVSAPAGNALCTSLVSLAKANALPLEDTLTLPVLLEHLIAAFQGAAYEVGRNSLNELRDVPQSVTVASGPPVTAEVTSEPVSSGEDNDDVMSAGVEDEGGGVTADHDPDTAVLPTVEHTDAVTDREVSSSDDTHKS